MTGTEFRTLHGDPTTWTTTDIETQQNLAEIDHLTRTCWFCAAENPRTRNTCGFCNHHADDGPDAYLTAIPAAA
ncbi:hypothetical protein [Streptomyces sp. NPDC051992]|uniref:hypothetical protein n=1 Tax=unclassified Streptomyces TaxID=2593676 RepID=UPI0034498E92